MELVEGGGEHLGLQGPESLAEITRVTMLINQSIQLEMLDSQETFRNDLVCVSHLRKNKQKTSRLPFSEGPIGWDNISMEKRGCKLTAGVFITLK